MKKVALVFAVAVIAPSLVLAWLAVRSLRDQQVVIERQQERLAEGVAEAAAARVQAGVMSQQGAFAGVVEQLLATNRSAELVIAFDDRLRRVWPLADVGFVVSLQGEVQCPSMFNRPAARQFRLENDNFLCSREPVSVVWESPKGKSFPVSLEANPESKAKDPASVFATKAKAQSAGRTARTAASPIPPDEPPAPASRPSQFREIVGDASEGTVARFLQNQLNLLFWYRPPADSEQVFGALVNLDRLVADLRSAFLRDLASGGDLAVALRDDTGKPVIVSPAGFTANWKRPFVTAAVGEVLPHWEVSVYWLNPAQLGRTATSLRVTLGLLIGVLVLAIGVGSWLIVTDLRRQLALARQKTDFVSNVSHELKTPLTNIRLFSEMLAEGRVREPEKQRQFLGVITAEAGRLTRLINNVLDFARMERGDRAYHFASCDLAGLAREAIETCRPQLAAAGFTLHANLPTQSVLIRGDRDALAQVLLNLLSNAEKYSADRKEITVSLERDGQGIRLSVMDRGLGVPPGCQERIFEQFFRAHDSLASGVGGAGLGLTLARQIARAHGGDVTCAARESGGSIFTLHLAAA